MVKVLVNSNKEVGTNLWSISFQTGYLERVLSLSMCTGECLCKHSCFSLFLITVSCIAFLLTLLSATNHRRSIWAASVFIRSWAAVFFSEMNINIKYASECLIIYVWERERFRSLQLSSRECVVLCCLYIEDINGCRCHFSF